MNSRMTQLAIAALLVVPISASAAEHKNLKAFAPAREGMERFVIVLPHKERGEDGNFKVELVVGKMIMTDGVNSARLGAKIEPKPLKGWGFTYYEVTKVGPVASTLIGVPPGTPKVRRFVGGSPLQIRYNSRIPIVVYVPTGCEVRYRIWEAPVATIKADKG